MATVDGVMYTLPVYHTCFGCKGRAPARYVFTGARQQQGGVCVVLVVGPLSPICTYGYTCISIWRLITTRLPGCSEQRLPIYWMKAVLATIWRHQCNFGHMLLLFVSYACMYVRLCGAAGQPFWTPYTQACGVLPCRGMQTLLPALCGSPRSSTAARCGHTADF